MNRVRLLALEVVGDGVPPAELIFDPGLNVLSGPENRGKSFAFQCLDFMFASKEAPKDISESDGYSEVRLVFEVDNGKRRAVRRSLVSKEAHVSAEYAADESIPPERDWRKVAQGSNAKGVSLSSFWLSIFGIAPTKLRTNKSGDLGTMSVRHVVHMALIDEMRMIRKESPVLGENGFSDTLFTNAFAFMLGAHDSPLPIQPKPREGLAGRHEVMTAMLAEVDAELLSSSHSSADANDPSSLLDEYREAVSSLSSRVAVNLLARKEADLELIEVRSKLLGREELHVRLRLLGDYYRSDQKRLEAIAEASNFLHQMDPVACPTCAQEWPVELAQADIEFDAVLESCHQESSKIDVLVEDLGTEIRLVSEEVTDAMARESALAAVVERLDGERIELSRQLDGTRERLADVLSALSKNAARGALVQRKDWLERQLSANEPPPQLEKPSERTRYQDGSVRQLCDRVAELLVSWKWHYTPGDVVVDFDEDEVDLRVSGKLRTSFGKAVRGLIVSALSLSVMEYCLSKHLPHPGFVVLDSPLTAHGQQDASGQADVITLAVQTAFFEVLATRYLARQVVVIDNKAPPSSLAGVRHIQFGLPGGRNGFFG